MASKILYIQYTNPAAYPPLEHSSRILAQDGWEVLFLGTGALGAADALCFPPHPNITVQQMPFCPPGWQQKLHYLRFCFWVLFWALRWRPHWVYASDLLACPIAILLSFLPGVRVIYHEHDSPATAADSLFLHLCMLARKGVAHRAQMCVLPNQQRAERFAEHTNCGRVICVWNCPLIEEAVQPQSQKNPHQLTIYFHGNISQDLLPVSILQALATLAGRVQLRVIGYVTIGQQEYLTYLNQEAKSLGIQDYVQFMGALPRHELWQLIGECDVGLALMPTNNSNPNLRFLTGASNKVFDYLACGLALLVSDLPDWKQMYVEPGYGLACNPNDPASIADALRWYLDHQAEMQEMGDRGRQRILTEWNYETQFKPVKDYMSKALF